MELNNKLIEVYSRNWENFSNELNKVHDTQPFAMPFLIDLSHPINNKFKIMIYGQETWGWHDGASLDNWIRRGMDGYKTFFWDKNFYEGYSTSSFWQAFRFFEKNIPNMLKDNGVTQEPVFIWNNISKLGLSNKRTGVSDTSRSLEREFFNVVSEEFEIIKPDLVIFLTGPNRDGDIKYNFETSIFTQALNNYSQRKMAKIKISGVCALRLYHPAYFAGFTKKYKKDALAVINELIAQAKKM